MCSSLNVLNVKLNAVNLLLMYVSVSIQMYEKVFMLELTFTYIQIPVITNKITVHDKWRAALITVNSVHGFITSVKHYMAQWG